nr:MAG TPA_asm: hypothetical protein [Caudoviricetes sp.]
MYIYPIESDTVYRVALDSRVNWISRQPDKSYEKQVLTIVVNAFIVRIMLRSSVAPKGALTTNPRHMIAVKMQGQEPRLQTAGALRRCPLKE